MMKDYTSSFELEYVIYGMKFNVVFEDGYFEKPEQKEILNYIDIMSKEMHIDSSYVEKKDSHYTSIFMLDDGWNALGDLIKDSQYGKYLHQTSQETLVDAFCMMGKCYMYECLALLYDFQHIQIDVDPNVDFDVAFLKDTSHAWKRYTGKWQTWKDDIWKTKNK